MSEGWYASQFLGIVPELPETPGEGNIKSFNMNGNEIGIRRKEELVEKKIAES
jgi:hypothetical protein